MKRAVLTDIVLPDFGPPVAEPVLARSIYLDRLARLEKRLAKDQLDAVVIYGDREHMANISWASGYDPRFEEAILIVVAGRTPTLLLGNEGFPFAEVANGHFERVLWQPLSLMGQPRQHYRALTEILREAGLKRGMRIGLAGWKGLHSEDGVFEPDWFEAPHYLVETLKSFGPLCNAAMMFMSPDDGLRALNEVDQLACFEYAATLSSNALKRVILGTRPGMSEYESVSLMRLNGFPQSAHVNMSAGARAKFGLPSPSSRVIEPGDPIVVGLGLMGALNCRAGFMVKDATGLPPGIQDYVEKLVGPYFEAVAAWYGALRIGVTGGELYDAVMSRIGDPFFGIGLNPGHLIHLDEWMHSPVRKNSAIMLASGMAIQCDVIPATGTDYFTTNIEDGVALADAATRKTFAASYPEAWTRVEQRRAFMAGALGIRLAPEVLPFSNIPAWLPPFWLSPGKAMAIR